MTMERNPSRRRMNFSAVILAGGKSSRMGRDKAALEFAGKTLLERQVDLARSVGATTIFISGPPQQDDRRFGCPVLTDRFPDSGPLAGIERGLVECPSPFLLVLAVDMPLMSREVLQLLLTQGSESLGTVPCIKGQIEPLAALYPKKSAPLAGELLARSSTGGNCSGPGVRIFAERCFRAGLIRWLELPEKMARCFVSWNTPSDLAGISEQA